MDYGCVILKKLGRREMTNESEDDLAHKVLKDIKKRIHEAPNMADVFKKIKTR
mgnify:CR=1 FL=1